MHSAPASKSSGQKDMCIFRQGTPDVGLVEFEMSYTKLFLLYVAVYLIWKNIIVLLYEWVYK